jgi:SnoaL-like domain
MSEENVEVVRRGYEQWLATGELLPEITHPDFAWDMSTFRGWPEQQTYPGIEGARQFNADWAGAWDDWEIEAEDYIDAGDRIVVVLRQRGEGHRGARRHAPWPGVDTPGRAGNPDADVRDSGGSPRSCRAFGVGDVGGERRDLAQLAARLRLAGLVVASYGVGSP